MKRRDSGSSGAPENGELIEISGAPVPNVAPPRPPTLAEWWRHKGFLFKALIIGAPLLLLAMCMASVPPDATVGPSTEPSDIERRADQLDAMADNATADTAIEPDQQQTGPATCASIEPEVARLFAKNSGKAVIEINNSKAEVVDGNPDCLGSILTEAGTVFVAYGTQVTEKGQLYIYVRPTLDVVIPPGMENMKLPRLVPTVEKQPESTASPDEPSSTPTPAASSDALEPSRSDRQSEDQAVLPK